MKRRPRITEDEKGRMVAAYALGASIHEIARSLGRSYNGVWGVLTRDPAVKLRRPGVRRRPSEDRDLP